MARLIPVSRRKLVERFKELGFDGPYSGGKHPQMRRGNLTIIIPNPHQSDISIGLLRRILQQANVSKEEWLGEDLN